MERGTKDLTDRQVRILEAIHEGIQKQGLPPTMRELAEKVGLASPSSVKAQLHTLEKRGYIKRDEGLSRAAADTLIAVLEGRGELWDGGSGGRP